MVELYGRTLSRREVSAHMGMLTQVAGVRLMTLGDGIERATACSSSALAAGSASL